jgi:O-antigen biosynthesis protein
MIHVIIPIHNRLNLSINCLNSLTKIINYNELNIIIVDDGSTDGSRHILKKNFLK